MVSDTGYPLKTKLKKIIDSNNDGLSPEYLHIDRGYGSGTSTTNNGLWTAYGTTDRDLGIGYENDNTIVDMYSERPTSSDPYNFNYNTASGGNAGQCGSYTGEGDCYNREHLVPQAYFDHFQVDPMKNDPNFVIPTDGKVNGVRDNFPFGRVNTASYTSQNGSKLGSNVNSGYSAGYTSTVFEPIDEFKGDIARCILYFATRYEDFLDEFYAGATVQSKDMFDGSNGKSFSNTFLNILLTWHLNDPVSTKEINRNNAVFNFQNNRNPYIDHPEYVCRIWSTQCATLSSESFDALANISIYPNPTKDNRINITSEVELSEIQLININGQVIQMIKNPNRVQNSYTLENLPQGFYFVKLSSADNQTTTKKILVN
ncbi:putative extracellular ribonuclease [Flavobacterium cauense R2A-7]|nr:putative extracellular ribonuclease [Flavobacterium cauense R2A-7]